MRMFGPAAGTLLCCVIACGGPQAPASHAGESVNAEDEAPGTEGDDDGRFEAAASVRPPGDRQGVLADESARIFLAMRSSNYQHKSRIDEKQGIFDFDCSGFVNYVLARSAPDALSALHADPGRRPLAKSYVAVLEQGRAPWRALR